jgi:hypothetical protein
MGQIALETYKQKRITKTEEAEAKTSSLIQACTLYIR